MAQVSTAVYTSSDGTTFTTSPTTSATTIGTTTIGTTTIGTTTIGTISTSSSISNNSGGITGACMHGVYGACSMCYPTYTQQCTCTIWGSTCPVHTVTINTPSPSWVTWPPTPPQVDLHSKEGHRISHEMVTDEKGLKIVFKCSFCNEVIYKKYIVRIPRKVREEKCLVRVLNHK